MNSDPLIPKRQSLPLDFDGKKCNKHFKIRCGSITKNIFLLEDSTPEMILQKLSSEFGLDINGFFHLVAPNSSLTVHELMLINPNLPIVLCHKPSILWTLRHIFS